MFFVDRRAHPQLPLSPQRSSGADDLAAGESPALYAQRIRAMELTVRPTVRELLAAAQTERKAKLDAGRVDTAVFKGGDRVLLQTKELLSCCSTLRTSVSCARGVTVTAPSP